MAVLSFFVGVLLVGFAAAWFIIGVASGFDSEWWRSAIMVVLLWGGFYGLDLALTRRYSPEPADTAEIAAHQEIIDGWLQDGVTAYEVFRLRPKGKGLVLAHVGQSGDTAHYWYVERGRGTGLLLSKLEQGRGYLSTTWESLGLFSYEETRQIVHSKEWEPVFDIHRHALDYIRAGGVAVDTIAMGSLADLLVDMQRGDRRWLRRFPVGFLGGFFRPIFHLGGLRTRIGRHWQLRHLRD